MMHNTSIVLMRFYIGRWSKISNQNYVSILIVKRFENAYSDMFYTGRLSKIFPLESGINNQWETY